MMNQALGISVNSACRFQRFDDIDIAKGVAISLVVSGICRQAAIGRQRVVRRDQAGDLQFSHSFFHVPEWGGMNCLLFTRC